MIAKLAWIALAGAAGTLCRYGLQGLVQRQSASLFPWGTFAVNMAGCFLFGVAWALAEEKSLLTAQVRTVILVGFMGAFTTFSSFAFETVQLMRDAQWLLAAANVVGQNVLGLAALVLGIVMARAL
jgi:CrcB protein